MCFTEVQVLFKTQVSVRIVLLDTVHLNSTAAVATTILHQECREVQLTRQPLETMEVVSVPLTLLLRLHMAHQPSQEAINQLLQDTR